MAERQGTVKIRERKRDREQTIALIVFISSVIVTAIVAGALLLQPGIITPATVNKITVKAVPVVGEFTSEEIDVIIYDASFGTKVPVKLSPPTWTATVTVNLMNKFYVYASLDGWYFVEQLTHHELLPDGKTKVVPFNVTAKEMAIELHFAKAGNITLDVYGIKGLNDTKYTELTLTYDFVITNAIANAMINITTNSTELNVTKVVWNGTEVEPINGTLGTLLYGNGTVEITIAENITAPVQMQISIIYEAPSGNQETVTYEVIFE